MAIEIPKEWKVAGTGEEELDYCFYDLVASGTTASATLTFFNQNEASNGIAVTNMPTSGQLPFTQRFLIEEIRLNFDPNTAAGDFFDILDAGIIDVKINGERKLCLPAIECVSPNRFTPSGVTATIEGLIGVGYRLKRALVIEGGVPFAVEMVVGKVAASASTDLYMELFGRYVRKE